MVSSPPPSITWCWNARSIRLTLTTPSRTRRQLSGEDRKGYLPADDIGAGDPIVKAPLLGVKADPPESEEERRGAGQVGCGAQAGPRIRRRIAVDVDDPQLHDPHAEGLA